MRPVPRSLLLPLCLSGALLAGCEPKNPPEAGENALTPGMVSPPAKGTDAPPPVNPAPGGV